MAFPDRRSIYIILLLAAIGVYALYFFTSIDGVQTSIFSKTKKIALPAETGEETVSSDNSLKETEGAYDRFLVIKGLQLEYAREEGEDILRIVPSMDTPQGENVSFRYKWTKNAQPAGTVDFLSGYKRGDKILVSITPWVGNRYGAAKSLELEIKNLPPKIMESKEYEINGNSLTFQVNAMDPDGDPVTYALIDAPAGMAIDQNGLITWTFGKEDKGSVTVKVKVSDTQGLQVTQDFTFNLGNQ